MQSMARAKLKAIIYKLLVFGINRAFYNSIAAIGFIVKQRMAYVFHMYPYLMCAACFQVALYERGITKPLNYFVVGNGLFTVLTFGKYIHHLPVAQAAAYVTGNGT